MARSLPFSSCKLSFKKVTHNMSVKLNRLLFLRSLTRATVFCAPGRDHVAHLARETHPDEGVLHTHKGGRARFAATIAKRVDGRRDRFHRALARFERRAH